MLHSDTHPRNPAFLRAKNILAEKFLAHQGSWSLDVRLSFSSVAQR